MIAKLGNLAVSKMYLGNTLISDAILGGTNMPPVPNLVSYFRFENSVNDEYSVNNGLGTNVTYNPTGKVGKSIIFSGTNSYVLIPDSDTLTFANSTNDLPFSITFSIKLNVLTRAWWISKRASTGNDLEWEILNNSGNLFTIIIRDSTNGAYHLKSFAWSPVAGTWYNLGVTYSGNGLASGLKLYKNAVSVGTTSSSGVYTRMRNGTHQVRLSGLEDNTFNLNGEMDNLKFWSKELSQAEVDAENI